jgi:alkylated DNA repair dioxygenase AlkB
VLPQQLTLLEGGGPPGIDPTFSGIRRRELAGGAWVEYAPAWVRGQQGLFDHLARTTAWRLENREMYDRTVQVPRLIAGLPRDGPGHPALEQMRAALDARYRTEFARIGMALYRDGNDSVAWHGDYVARELATDTLVATVSLGEPRRFLLRPAEGGGASVAYSLGWGDLIVMGGSCQRTWRHSIPKARHAEPRMAIMFRPVWEAPPGFRGRTGY